MFEKIKEIGKDIWKGLPMAHGQILFSNHLPFCFILMLVTMLEPVSGLAGWLCVLSAMLTARLFHFPTAGIRDGSYSFNALLTGLGLGTLYEPGWAWMLVIVLAGILCFFVTTWFSRAFSARYLPYLSLPFLFTLWIFLLGLPNFSGINLRGISTFETTDSFIQNINNWVDTLPFPNYLHLFFRSMGAIFFRYHDLAGILMTFGLLLASRLSVLFAIFGFSLGYLFFGGLHGDYSQLVYSYMGFNFILTSIALGGFFLVAHQRTFILLAFVIPIIAISISAFQQVFQVWNLPLYSLPFNVVVILILSGLSMRTYAKGIQMVTRQFFSPEKNHYFFHHETNRYKNVYFYSFSLPFLGEWTVSQGYQGGITHIGDWQYALDFDVRDEAGKTFDNLGAQLEDYYCYDLPVLAPADGYIITVIDGIADNDIGKIDLEKNWGNSIVIKHGQDIYTKLSHLKPFSITVKEGEYVYRGQILGACGSSGRSPEPHLHFQVQYTPWVGSKTAHYPLGIFTSRFNAIRQLHFFEVPNEGTAVINLSTTPSLVNAFNLVPGKRFSWTNEMGEFEEWEIYSNAQNQTYIYCQKTNSIAWFINTGMVFYFTHFEGNSKSLLYHFYLSTQKIVLGYVEDTEIIEPILMEGRFPFYIQWIQDFCAPFYHFCSSDFRFQFSDPDSPQEPSTLTIQSQINDSAFGRIFRQHPYLLQIKQGKWHQLNIPHLKQTWLCVG